MYWQASYTVLILVTPLAFAIMLWYSINTLLPFSLSVSRRRVMRQMENYVAGGEHFRRKVKRKAYPSTGGRQTSISLCYSLIRFIWPRCGPTLPVGRVSCAWWMLLSKMPRSIRDACTERKKEKGRENLLISKAPPMYHLCNLTLHLCNNIKREDNCCEGSLRLPSKFLKSAWSSTEWSRGESVHTVCQGS